MEKINKIILFIAVVFAFVGCTNVDKRRRTKSKKPVASATKRTKKMKIVEKLGDNEDVEDILPDKPVTPKVGLILGPGGVKTFSHTGVLSELIKARVPIDEIVGLEWGAYVASLFAVNKQIGEAEWTLYKIKDGDLPGKSFLTKAFKTEEIKDSLEKLVPGKIKNVPLRRFQIPFSCPVESVYSSRTKWIDSGSFSSALEKCMPYPPVFSPTKGWVAAAFQVEKAYKRLKESGMDLIVFVNVVGPGELLTGKETENHLAASLLWKQLRSTLRDLQERERKDFIVVNVPTGQYPLFSLKNRKLLVLAGRKAGKRVAAEIVEKFGL